LIPKRYQEGPREEEMLFVIVVFFICIALLIAFLFVPSLFLINEDNHGIFIDTHIQMTDLH
jgi:uncharacterized membrane protein YqiK